MKVRRIKCIKAVKDFLEKDEIYIEYGDIKGLFYYEKYEPTGVGFNLSIVEQYGGFDKYFIELESIDFSTTVRYLQIKDQCIKELEEIDYFIKEKEARKKEINELLKSF
jgi:hypothetical protein